MWSAAKAAPAPAFSLIEVTLALGICTFAIVALMGLMSVGITSNKASQQDTVIALEAQYVLSDLMRQPYPPAGTNYAFDYQGTATNAASYYRCAVTIVPDAAPSAWVNANAVGIKMTFTCPGQTNTAGKYAKTFWTSLSSY